MKIDGLKALNVFVDSSIFIGKNYRYDHPSFVALKDAVSAGRANLLVTDITIEEVKAHIGVVSPNPRKFRQPNFSPATIASRSRIWPVPRNV